MQNRYVGDIGDYVKLSLLRALCVDRRLGVLWYLTPDEDHNADGRHTSYLQPNQEHRWGALDREVYDSLRAIVNGGERSVAALERIPLATKATFVSKPVVVSQERTRWFDEAWEALRGSTLFFADPDNGIEPAGYRPGGPRRPSRLLLRDSRFIEPRLSARFALFEPGCTRRGCSSLPGLTTHAGLQ